MRCSLFQLYTLLAIYVSVLRYISSSRVLSSGEYGIENVTSRDEFEIEYQFTKKFYCNWQIGENAIFYLPNDLKVIGEVQFIKSYSKDQYFISGIVSNGGLFSASYYSDITSANIIYPNNTQYELRPYETYAENIYTKTVKYKMKKVNITEEYEVKDDNFRRRENDLMIAETGTNRDHLNASSPKRHYPNNRLANIMSLNDVPTSILKVLVMYTKAAVDAAGGESFLLATIALAVGNFDRSLNNSNVDIRVDYVAERMPGYDTYTEGSMEQMIVDLNSDVISTMRRHAVGAQAVQLVTSKTDYCGIANYEYNGKTYYIS